MTRVRVLGEVAAYAEDGTELPIGGPQQRRLLAGLVLHAGASCSLTWLEHALWPGEESARPSNPADVIRTYVARLRTVLGREAIVTGDGTYRLELPEAEIDVVQFDRLVDEALTPGRMPRARVELLNHALGLWHGEAYGAFADEDAFRIEHRRLRETRTAAMEAALAARLELGEHHALLPQIEAIAREHPLRETPHRLHMLALYRSGAQAEALRVFQSYRRLLGDELGLEPSAELVDLERQIVARDAAISYHRMGRRLREYQLGRQIGEGAFGTVHEALQPSLGRTVAVKAIRKELADRPEFIRQFDVEAHVIARLEHPNIVPLYDYWRDPSGAYLVIRHLSGGSLADRLRGGPQPVTEVRRWAAQLAAALDTAHRSGVVHGDLRPSNVLFDVDGNAYLVDFGIAVLDDAIDDAGLGSSGRNSAYRSPEALRREHVGPEADIHAFGVLLFEALTGIHPFTADSGLAVAERVLHDPLPPVAAFRSDVPSHVDQVLATATAKDPSARYPSVGAMIVELLAGSDQTLDGIHPGPHEVPNPYRGLHAFEEVDAGHFFGRASLVEEVVGHLAGDPPILVTVVGPSGSGKSSLVKAGVIPALRSGRVEGSERWFVATMTPGARPFASLRSALSAVAVDETVLDEEGRTIEDLAGDVVSEGSVLLLVVDQFEELFTICDDPDERARFLQELAAAVRAPRSPLRCVVTLRADFYDRPLQEPEIAELVKRQLVSVTPLTAEELEEVIVAPAAAVGVGVEPALLAEIVGEVVGRPGALPLLEYAVTELFEHRDGAVLKLSALSDLGGVAGTLPRRAEALYVAASEPEQLAIRHVFSRLVTPGEGTEDSRRRALWRELGHEPATEAVIAQFGKARLLSLDSDPRTREPTVEVAHEALIREWPRLRGWIDDDRADLLVVRHLHRAAGDWERGGRHDDELYRGGRLENAEGVLDAGQVPLARLEAEFLQASFQARGAVAAAAQRSGQRMRRLVVGACVFAVLALAAGAVAVWQQQVADARRYDAETARLASEAVALSETDSAAALALAVAAFRREASPQTLGALQRTLLVAERPPVTLQPGTRYLDAVWLPDGRVGALRSDGLEIVDVASGLVVERDEFETNPERFGVFSLPSIESSADGTLLAVATGLRQLRLYRLDTEGLPEPVTVLLEAPAISVSVSADGQVVVVGDTEARVSAFTRAGASMFPAPVQVTEHETWHDQAIDLGYEEESVLRLVPVVARVSLVGDTIWAGAGAVLKLYDLAGNLMDETLVAFASADMSNAMTTVSQVSPTESGALVIFGRGVATLAPTDRLPPRIDLHPFHPTPASTLPVASQVVGDSIVEVDEAGFVYVIDVSSGDVLDTLDLHTSTEIGGLAVEPGGHRVAVAHAAGIAVVVLDRASPLAATTKRASGELELSIAPEGDLVVARSEGQPHLWRQQPDGPLESVEFSLPEGILEGVAIRAGSSLMEVVTVRLVAGEDQLVQDRYDVATLERVSRTVGGAAFFTSDLATTPIGQLSVVALYAAFSPELEEDLIVIYREGEDGAIDRVEQLVRLGLPPGAQDVCSCVTTLQFDPAGERLLVASTHGGAVLYQVADDPNGWPTVLDEQLAGQDIVAGYWSPDGRLVATLESSGNIAVRDADTFETIRVLVGAAGPSNTAYGVLAFSSDGTLLVSAVERFARLWDLTTGQQIGVPFRNAADVTPGVNTGASHLRLVTATDEDVIVWNLDVNHWANIACAAAGSNLTQEEWERWGPSDTARYAVCPQYDLP